MLLDITEVDQDLVTLLSFHKDVLQECYQVMQMKPLKKVFKSLHDHRQDQLAGARAESLVIRADLLYEEIMDGGTEILVEWNLNPYVISQDFWCSLQATNVPVSCLYSREYVKVDRQPCIGPVSINAWFLIHNEYIKEIVAPIVYDHKSGAAYDATVYQYFVSLAMNSIIHIMLFYASWCCFFQAMAAICAERAKKMVGRGLKVEKFTVYKHMAYAKHKALAAWHLEASSCTMPSFPRDCSMPMKWSTERMDTGSSKAFVKAIQ